MKNTKTYTVQEARKKLERYCAYQERCHKDVISKLKEMNMIPLAIDTIVTHLITTNYLNEERFARSFARGKFNIKKWGRQRIIKELKARNISIYNINQALQEITGENYDKTFDELAEKRFSQLRDSHPLKKKKKLADYLLYRGWESEMVYKKVNELIR